MRKATQLISLGALLFSSFAMASVRPVVTFSLGSDSATFSKTNTNISFLSPFYNTYVDTNSSDAEWVGGLFLGVAFNLNSIWSSQLGISYYQNSAFQSRGDQYYFGDPNFNDVGYEYYMTSHRLLAEAKLLYTVKNIFHPYVDVGVGEAFNNAEDYSEHPYDTTGVSTGAPFGNHSTGNFTYTAGLGVDMDVSKQVRMGVGYRYADLGKVGLGTSSLQADTNTLQKNSITSNEFLFQISTIC